MSINLRLPNITETTTEGKLKQMQSFLYQTVEQLNWALNALETSCTGAVVMQGKSNAGGSSGSGDKKDSGVNFSELKALIIKSADIVEAYYEKISEKLSGKYVAVSDFGKYEQDTDFLLYRDSKNIEQLFSNVQTITTDIDGLNQKLIDVEAYIKSGELYTDNNGIPIYGLEIGQTTEIDGEEVFNKFARFTSDRLSFYDYAGNEVAYISDRQLYIGKIVVTVSFSQGGFVDEVQPDKSVITRWVGGEM